MIFKPSIKLTLVLFLLLLVFMRLGLWQLERQTEKKQMFDRFENAPVLGIEQALLGAERFARIEAYGHYDSRRHVLLDNKIHNGRAGVHVLTPFTLSNGTSILVNRGWLPLPPDRRSLPPIPGDDSMRMITGRLNSLPTGGPRIGDADILEPDRWPQMVTYFDPEAVNRALGRSMAPWLVQLDPMDASGFDGRQWKAAVMGPEVHGAYALQWFSLMIATMIIWLTLGVRRAQQQSKRQAENKTTKERQ
jgi:cytochrome oxidase assembly protein ShyY1